MRTWPLIVAVAMLAGGLGAQRSLSHGEPVLSKKPFAEFPLRVAGRWQGKELDIEPRILKVLGLDDYLLRLYVPVPRNVRVPYGRLATNEPTGTSGYPASGVEPQVPVSLYVGYYQSQRTGSTYHSPKHCLPGAGWQFVEAEQVAVTVDAVGRLAINKVHIRKDANHQVVLYWYQDRGRVIASEYRAKAYLLWDAMTKNRTDGALVKISVPVTTTVEIAYEQGLMFLRDVWPLLGEYMPSAEEL